MPLFLQLLCTTFSLLSFATGYTHNEFQPSSRPGLEAACYNGARKSEREDTWWTNRRTPPFKKCPIAANTA